MRRRIGLAVIIAGMAAATVGASRPKKDCVALIDVEKQGAKMDFNQNATGASCQGADTLAVYVCNSWTAAVTVYVPSADAANDPTVIKGTKTAADIFAKSVPISVPPGVCNRGFVSFKANPAQNLYKYVVTATDGTNNAKLDPDLEIEPPPIRLNGARGQQPARGR